MTRGHDVEEARIVRTRRQWQVELGSLRGSATRFLLTAGAGIQVAAILVQVGEDHRRVAFEGVEDAVAVMRIDVDIRDASEPETAAQQLDGDSAVVEYAKARGVVARGVVESGDRHECPAEVAAP